MCPCTCKNYFERKCSQKSKQKTFANKAGKGGEVPLAINFFHHQNRYIFNPMSEKNAIAGRGRGPPPNGKILRFCKYYNILIPCLGA